MNRLTKKQLHNNKSANKGKGSRLEFLFGKLLGKFRCQILQQ